MQLPYRFRIESFLVFELTDTGEYQALSAANKDAYKMILSTTIVDLNEGSLAQTLLWNMFPENSVTGARLRDPANRLIPDAIVLPP